MSTVYLETTIPSYLAANLSGDVVTAAHQKITEQWWATAADRFDIYISEAVLEEIRRGDPVFAVQRLKITGELGVLAFSEDVRSLIRTYNEKLGLAGKAKSDLPHFAYAVAYNMDYLVTWNCAHIANAAVVRRLRTTNADMGRETPEICTPEELLTAFPGEET